MLCCMKEHTVLIFVQCLECVIYGVYDNEIVNDTCCIFALSVLFVWNCSVFVQYFWLVLYALHWRLAVMI